MRGTPSARSESEPKIEGVKPYLVTGFITLHVFFMFLATLPTPDAQTIDGWKASNSAGKTTGNVRFLYDVFGGGKGISAFKKSLFDFVDGRVGDSIVIHDAIRPYTYLAGGQSWDMFRDVPRSSAVAMIAVTSTGSDEPEVWLDGHWYESGDERWDYRHRKAQNAMRGSPRCVEMRDYVAFWARRWREEHPDRPISDLELYYLRSTTPSPEEVREGISDVEEDRLEGGEWHARAEPTQKQAADGKKKEPKEGDEP